jgi:hypothetical protein
MYATAVKMANEHFNNICNEAARLVKDQDVKPYSEYDRTQLTQRLTVTLKEQLRYLETTELNAWKEYCTNTAIQDISRGVDYINIIRINSCVIKALTQFYDNSLATMSDIAGVEPEKACGILRRRLLGMDAVATSTTTTLGLKAKNF